MDVILKSIRALIRQTIKECGIKCLSNDTRIWTRCFASTPMHSIEYDGPVHVDFREFPRITVVAYTVAYTAGFTAGFVTRPTSYPEITVEARIGLDINDPTVLEKLKSFLAKHIPDKIKAFDHSKLYRHSKDNFVPDVATPSIDQKLAKLTWWGRVKLAWKLFRGDLTILRSPVDSHHDFYWEQALLRHFHDLDVAKVATIRQTILDIESTNQSYGNVIATTQGIRTRDA